MTAEDRITRGGSHRLVDFLDENCLVSERVFEDLTLTGPAIVVASGCQFRSCEFGVAGGDIEAILWPFPEGEYAVGCVGAEAVLFERVSFRRIGFTGTPETLDQFRRAARGEDGG